MDVTPSDVYGPQKSKVDWSKSTTNHTASPALVNPGAPQQNNYKENHNRGRILNMSNNQNRVWSSLFLIFIKILFNIYNNYIDILFN